MKKNEGAKVAKKQRKKVETPKIVVPKMKTMKIVDLIPYVNNAKRHTDEQIAMIAESIKARGFFGTVVVDSEGVIVVGHGRVAAAEKAGMKEIPVQVADHLSADEIRAHRLADNRLAEITGLDPELAKIELETLRDNEFPNFESMGYDEGNLAEIFEEEGEDRGGGSGAGGVGSLPKAIQLEPAKEYVVVVADNDEEWERLKEALGLSPVRRGGYKKGSAFDSVGVQRVVKAADILGRLKKC